MAFFRRVDFLTIHVGGSDRVDPVEQDFWPKSPALHAPQSDFRASAF